MSNKKVLIELLKEELKTTDYSILEKRWIEDVILTIESKVSNEDAN